jgi:glycerol-3-phosphate acyltransferase PlsX
MSKTVKIAIDAMGGEDAPMKNIEGVRLFISKNNSEDFFFNIYGNETLILKELEKNKIKNKYYKIFHTEKKVLDDQSPLSSIKNSKDTSMWNSISSQTENISDITLSAGNTGVLLVISKMILKTLDGVSKPALAGLWPNKNNMSVVLDLGANIECDENNLSQFAEMGSALYRSLFPQDTPKVSILNIGSEEIKGTNVIKKTNSILQKLSSLGDFNYVGYVEGNKIMDGETNVIVTDGFTGNVALKTAEGTAKFLTDNLKKSLTSNLISRISILLSYFSLKKFKQKLDPRKYNGAILLGLKGPVVKSHGSTDALGFSFAIDLCYRIIKGELMPQIKNNLSHIKDDKSNEI